MNTPPPDFERLLRSQLRRTRLVGAFVGTLTLVLALAMIFLAPQDNTMTMPLIYLSIAVGALFLVVAVLLFRLAFRPSPILSALQQAPHTIVWVYVQQVVTTQGRQTHASNLMVCFSDGKRQPIMTTPAHAALLLEGFQARLPHARVGFTPELEKAYRSDPNSLGAAPRS